LSNDYIKTTQEKVSKCDILKSVEGWVLEYPQYAKIADEQMHTFWPWDEPEVDNDVQDLRVRLTDSERHGLISQLKLFTKYEQIAGDDYWTGRFMDTFKRPELQRMATMFGAVELNSHAPFYNKINELLFLDTEEFYAEWKLSPALVDRMKFIGKYVESKNDLLSLAAFSFIEGAVLYSSFAFIKHFQAQECGKDLIKNICRGINLSVADENTHAVGGAMVFRDLVREAGLTTDELEWLYDLIGYIALQVYHHEAAIIEDIYSQGDIANFPKQGLLDFVKHRCNLCLSNLGIDTIFEEDQLDGSIKAWFYKNINSVQFHDFFTGGGSEYNLKWKEAKFGAVWESKV